MYLYTMEFYAAIKKNEILFVVKWMELENIILSEVSNVQKAKGHVFSHPWNSDLIQIQTKSRKTCHFKRKSHTRQGS
jgi:hypothetical protein